MSDKKASQIIEFQIKRKFGTGSGMAIDHVGNGPMARFKKLLGLIQSKPLGFSQILWFPTKSKPSLG
jgi:hypothetical protein